jgi:hypothetical protein
VIAGEARRQIDLRTLVGHPGRCLHFVDVVFVPEPENAFDSNAVRAEVVG